MRNQRGLLSLVEVLKSHKKEEIANLSRSILAKLDNSNQENETPNPNVDTPTQVSNCSTPSSSGAGRSGKRKPKTVTIYVVGLTNEDARKQLSQALLKIKGVISFLIDLYAQKAVVRTMTTPNTLIQQLEISTQMKISLQPIQAVVAPKTEFDPDYLPDSDDEEEPIQSHNALARQKTDDEPAQAQNWGWGFGRIAKALWG